MLDKLIVFFSRKEVGLAIGLPFTAVVVGLLIYGNFFASSSNPQAFTWEYRAPLHICDTAPSWVRPGHPQFEKTLAFLAERGIQPSSIEVGPCSTTCRVEDEKTGEIREKTCVRGKVAVDIMDQWWDPDHAGLCTYPKRVQVTGVAGDDDWATITLPEVIAEPIPEDGLEHMRPLPADVEALVLTHELGHCLLGLEHNVGPVVIPYLMHLNPKTGAVMNPNTYAGGWVDEAFPTAPEGW